MYRRGQWFEHRGLAHRHAERGGAVQRRDAAREARLKYLHDDWGTDQTYNHMAVGWTWAFDTPYKWTKQIASHFGGTRQGMVMPWPNRI
ncbi:MAG: hypothetical protein WAT36_09515 [Chromatiaceae bacterium]